MVFDDAARQLREQGCVLLREVFPRPSLARLKEAATRFFDEVRTEPAVAERYRFNRYSYSVPLNALNDFGCDPEELTAPLSIAGLNEVLVDAMRGEWSCSMDQCWVRKKFAPCETPGLYYHPQDWHQDGALGVQFPPEAGPELPMTQLLTCWIPLTRCGTDSPGLEFVKRRQLSLLHFTELNDAELRRRFAPEEFWAPELEVSDGLIFLNGTLHRTHASPGMKYHRLSVEYRIFPGTGAASKRS